jgi:hypothetical protein
VSWNGNCFYIKHFVQFPISFNHRRGSGLKISFTELPAKSWPLSTASMAQPDFSALTANNKIFAASGTSIWAADLHVHQELKISPA